MTRDVADYRRLAYKLAHDEARSSARPLDVDELAQEAMIAMHAAIVAGPKGDHDDVTAPYLALIARRRIADIARRGRPLTGAPDRNGKRPDALADAGPLELDGILGDPYVVDPEDRPSAAALEDVDTRDELAPVREAIAELRPEDRMHVYLRFWHGQDPPEVAEALGLRTTSVHDAWRKRIKPQLRALLADLNAA